VPEVSIYFDSVLIRGNRSTKLSAEAFDAFASPDCPPLAEAGIRIRYNRSVIRRPEDWTRPLKVHDRLDTRVSILKVHPGITPEVVTVFLLAPEIRAVILETYGSGNAISRPWFLALIREAAKTKVIVNVTQCKSGTVNMDIYATGKTLKLAGVVSGQDITTEAALGKLFVLMGLYEDNEQVKNRFGEDLIGEISK
jgi:L-asparaginase